MKKYFIVPFMIAVITLLGAESSLLGAEDLSASLMLPSETNKLESVILKNNQPHSRATLSIKRKEQDGKIYYVLNQKTKGDYQEFQDIEYITQSRMIEEDGLLKILKSSLTIREKDKVVLRRYEKSYDYSARQATFVMKDAMGRVVKRKSFAIKGPICDDSNLFYFLKTFVANRKNPEFAFFYLLSIEGKMYKVRFDERATEVIDMPFGRVKALKFQMKADFGPLTNLIVKFIPDTYIWFKADYPHEGLKYEGFESGPQSPLIKSYLVSRTPPIKN